MIRSRGIPWLGAAFRNAALQKRPVDLMESLPRISLSPGDGVHFFGYFIAQLRSTQSERPGSRLRACPRTPLRKRGSDVVRPRGQS
jgi:hypothetical protein